MVSDFCIHDFTIAIGKHFMFDDLDMRIDCYDFGNQCSSAFGIRNNASIIVNVTLRD